ncbi:MAG: hypothetical protein SGJ13_00880, partial [Actinomycetota bacterium]|nr:hypothetical protein [Actinomycetota bacterium]
AAGTVLDAEPWSEGAYRILVAAALAVGDRAGATHALERCDAMLGELGAPAAPETEILRRLAAR